MLISQVEMFGSYSFRSGTPAEYCHSPSGEGVWADASRAPAAASAAQADTLETNRRAPGDNKGRATVIKVPVGCAKRT